MKITLRAIALVLLVKIALMPQWAWADQTDSRLDSLFATLKSGDSAAQQEAENDIWAIWFESGDAEIDALMASANGAVNAGQLKQAEAMYSRVIERSPRFSEGWNRRATVRYYRRDFEGSLDDIQHTLRLEPRHFGAIWGLGMILGAQRNFTGAIVAFEKLLEIKPNASDAPQRIELLKKERAKGSV